jgi:hypothetical protein
MTVRILGVVALIALIALAPAHAQRRDSKALKDARGDIEAARTLPPYSSSFSGMLRSLLVAVLGPTRQQPSCHNCGHVRGLRRVP